MENKLEEERQLRREAIQIAAQLPPDRRRALRVLELTRVLLLQFLEVGDNTIDAVVRPFPSLQSAADQEQA